MTLHKKFKKWPYIELKKTWSLILSLGLKTLLASCARRETKTGGEEDSDDEHSMCEINRENWFISFCYQICQSHFPIYEKNSSRKYMFVSIKNMLWICEYSIWAKKKCFSFIVQLFMLKKNVLITCFVIVSVEKQCSSFIRKMIQE